jgi:hypothetical protein
MGMMSLNSVDVGEVSAVWFLSQENDHAKPGGVDGGEADIDGESSGQSGKEHVVEV